MASTAAAVYLERPMGIVLTVLEPPHHPEPKLVAALPPGTGRVIDVEPRLVSPRFDTLLVTSRGLVVRDHVSGQFHGVPWANFSLDAHLRQHNRHAVLTLWLNQRRPMELAITRRVALNIASVAPVLTRHPTEPVDDIVVAGPVPDTIDLREPAPARAITTPPRPSDRVDGLRPPEPVPTPQRPTGAATPAGQQPAQAQRRSAVRLMVGLAVLVVAGAVGGAASMMINGADTAADGSVPTITSEAVDAGHND